MARSGCLGGLDGVDVEVIGPGVVGIALHHRLQCRYDFVGIFSWLAVFGPVVPGHQVHQRFGEKGRLHLRS